MVNWVPRYFANFQANTLYSPIPGPLILDNDALARRLDKLQPDLIVNAAAIRRWTRHNQIASAFAVNADLPRVLAGWAAERAPRLFITQL